MELLKNRHNCVEQRIDSKILSLFNPKLPYASSSLGFLSTPKRFSCDLNNARILIQEKNDICHYKTDDIWDLLLH